MNLGQMRERCKHLVRDLTSIITPNGIWDQNLNAGYIEFLARSEFNLELEFETISAASGSRSVDLPPGVFRVLSVRDLTNGKELHDAGPWRNIVGRYPNPSDTDEPMRYKVIGNGLHLFPRPNATTSVEVLYFAEPEPLVQDSDVPILPTRYHEAIVDWACSLAFKADHDWEAADRFQRDFNQLVDIAKEEFGAYPQGGYAPLPRTRYMG